MINSYELNRPMESGPGNKKVYVNTDKLARRFQNDSNGNIIYAGEAEKGSSESATVWKIKLFAYDGNDFLSSITWPENSDSNASDNYEFAWSNRASETYS